MRITIHLDPTCMFNIYNKRREALSWRCCVPASRILLAWEKLQDLVPSAFSPVISQKCLNHAHIISNVSDTQVSGITPEYHFLQTVSHVVNIDYVGNCVEKVFYIINIEDYWTRVTWMCVIIACSPWDHCHQQCWFILKYIRRNKLGDIWIIRLQFSLKKCIGNSISKNSGSKFVEK